MDFPQAYARCVEKQNSFLPNPAPNDEFEKANKCLEAINKVYGELLWRSVKNAGANN